METEIREYSKNVVKTPGVLRSPLIEEMNWYVFYTYPKAEKVVHDDLIKRKYEVYLPLTSSLRLWKNGQKKLIEIPLFPNYIFVKLRPYELHIVLKVPKVVTYISCGNKPSIMQPKEIETIKTVLSLGLEVSVEGKYFEGDKVRIKSGPFVGNEGVLIKQTGKTRFGILLHGIKYSIIIDMCKSHIESIIK